MGVAHTLSRRFFRSENILWKEDLMERHATFFLNGKDSIINAPQVRAYLQDTGRQQTANDTSQTETNIAVNTAEKTVPADWVPGRLKVVWCADLDHGQIFDLPIWRTRLVNEILVQVTRGA